MRTKLRLPALAPIYYPIQKDPAQKEIQDLAPMCKRLGCVMTEEPGSMGQLDQ